MKIYKYYKKIKKRENIMKKFTEFRNRLNENFNKLASENDYLFEVNLNKDELYDLYLNSFPKRTNPIFRERNHLGF